MFAQTSDPEAQSHESLRTDPSTTDPLEVKEKDFALPLPSGPESVVPKPEQVSLAMSIPDSAPDGGYGWVCVICMLLITANTWGVNGVCIRRQKINNDLITDLPV